MTGIYADVDRRDIPDPGPGLRGRQHECEVLDRLVADARAVTVECW